MIYKKIKYLLMLFLFGFTISPLSASEQRLISTDSGATKLIISLGLDSQLIAIDVTSQLPANHKPLKQIGYHRNLSAEGLLSLEPTTIIGSEHMGPASVISVLEQANINIIRLKSANNPEQLRENISKLSLTLNQEELGNRAIKELDEKLNELKVQEIQGKKIAFLLNMDNTQLRLAGNNSGGAALIKLMGGINAADFNNYQTVSSESLLTMNPAIILVSGSNMNSAVDDLLKHSPILLHTEAGLNNNIVAVDGSTIIAGLSISSVEEALRLVEHLNSHNTQTLTVAY